jgi:hypothetical protein
MTRRAFECRLSGLTCPLRFVATCSTGCGCPSGWPIRVAAGPLQPSMPTYRGGKWTARKADMTIELADGTKLRRDFKVPKEDAGCLAALGFTWVAVVEGGTKWLIIHPYPIPDGYNHRTAVLALRMPPPTPTTRSTWCISAGRWRSPAAGRSASSQGPSTARRTSNGRGTARQRIRGAPASTMSARICSRLTTADDWLQRELK